MAIIVELPRLSDTMEEGVIAKWRVNVGDKVKRGQVIADIETDKATMEFESFDAGIVLKLVAPEGETLPLGAPIAVLGKEGEDPEAALGGRAGGDKPIVDTPKPSSAPTEIPSKAPAAAKDLEAAEAGATKPEDVPAKGAATPTKAAAAAPAVEAKRGNGKPPASPLARKLARDHGVALDQVTGSGPHGRIVKSDVLAAAQQGKSGGPAGTVVSRDGRSFVSRPDTPMKLSQMRKTIAKRMAQANAEIPHFYLRLAIDMTQAVALRQQLTDALPDVKISFNDIVVFGVARALVKHPEINAYWDGQTIVRRGDIHIGIAVAVDEGLLVPPVKHAEQKSLSQIAVEVRDLGTRAKEKKLAPEEMTGSTFTVSNLGMFGIDDFAAVINPGEGAILAVGAIADEAVVIDGAVVVRKRMRVNLACDHRVMDGATGAKFLATLRTLLERPVAMLA
jgi:pyruvate dehydrogenase E2 component (dihydrolipoamide acetyltransferase)